MGYAKQYLGKELNEIIYSDMEDYFIYAKDESDKIEFKSYYSTEKKNILKKRVEL